MVSRCVVAWCKFLFMRIFRVLAASSALAVLTACGSESTTAVAPTGSPQAATASPAGVAQEVDRNESVRGNLIKEIGEVGGTGHCGDDPCLTFVMTSIDVSDQCESTGGVSPQGQFVHASMRIDTHADAASEMPDTLNFNASSWAFTAIDSDGFTISSEDLHGGSDSFFYCDFPPTIEFPLKPASKYQVDYLLDVPLNATHLVMSPYGGAATWEWELP